MSRKTKIAIISIFVSAIILALVAGARWETTKDFELNSCLEHADDEWWDTWKLNCDDDNIKYEESGEIKSCSVPNHLSKSIHDQRQTDKENCFRRFDK